jgi:hypothetical protein
MNLEELKKDCSIKQKKGIHFIIASVIIWGMVLIVHSTSMEIMNKNLFTFCCTSVLFPIALLISKILKIDFQNKSNPLTKAGILFSVNQMLYILIVMWVYSAVPHKMVKVFAMVFGAHLMPFSWLYDSKNYLFFSIFIPIISLIVGIYCEPYIVAFMMLVIEIIFSILLALENKTISN